MGVRNGAARRATATGPSSSLRDAPGRPIPPASHRIGAQLSLDVSDEVIEAIAQRAADLLAERTSREPERWIGVEEAAAHLGCPRSRIYRLVSRRAIPYQKDGNRLLFRRSLLDEWVQQGGAAA